MSKICLFSSYSLDNIIPNYVKYYLENLKKYFDEIILITNRREIITHDINFLNVMGVSLKMVENEGLDFGMWYKSIMELNIDKYNQIGLINDSCILFDNKGLDKIMRWVNSNNLDYCGITDSGEIGYHIQSYFIIIKESIIPKVYEYFRKYGIINNIRDLINKYEVGLSQYLLNSGYKIGSYFSHIDYDSSNISIVDIPELIKNGYPMIKKKPLTNSFREDEISYLKTINFDFKIPYKEIISKKISNGLSIDYLLDGLDS